MVGIIPNQYYERREIMEQYKEYFDIIVDMLMKLFELIKVLVNTDTESGILDVAAAAEEAGLLEAASDLGGKAIDAVK